MSDWKEARHLATLADAYAETGDFEKAVEWQRKANDLYTDEDEVQAGRGQLERYRAKEPYREGPAQ